MLTRVIFSLVQWVVHVCGHVHMRSQVSQGMDYLKCCINEVFILIESQYLSGRKTVSSIVFKYQIHEIGKLYSFLLQHVSPIGKRWSRITLCSNACHICCDIKCLLQFN